MSWRQCHHDDQGGRLVPQCCPTCHPASAALDASPDLEPGPTRIVSPQCRLQLSHARVCWKNQTVPHGQVTRSGRVLLQARATPRVILGPSLLARAEHKLGSPTGPGSRPRSPTWSQPLALPRCSLLVCKVAVIMLTSEASGGWTDKAEPGTKLLSKAAEGLCRWLLGVAKLILMREPKTTSPDGMLKGTSSEF